MFSRLGIWLKGKPQNVFIETNVNPLSCQKCGSLLVKKPLLIDLAGCVKKYSHPVLACPEIKKWAYPDGHDWHPDFQTGC
jgi:hypothetical protein